MTTLPPRVEGIEIRDWSQVTAELVFLYEGAVETAHLRMRRYFDDLSAVLIREGTAVLETGRGGRVTASAGDWVLAPQGQRSQEYSPGARVLSIHFLLSWPGRLPVYDWDHVIVIPSSALPEMEEAGSRLEQWVSREVPGDGRRVRYARTSMPSYFRLHRRFLEWLEHYADVLEREGLRPIRLGKVDSRVLKAAQLLERHPLRTPIRQAALAAEVNLSINQLARLFRSAFRMTPKAYLERRRVREAYLRVQSSTSSFKELAYDLGFHSPSHFSTWFVRQFGHTPSEVREVGHSLFPRQL